MQLEFCARYFESSEEDDVLIVGFADSTEDDPQQYLVLQRSCEHDEQDEALGQDTYHVEIASPALSGYGGIEDVCVRPDRITFTMAASTPWCVGFHTIEIALAADLQRNEAIGQALQALFLDTPTRFSRG
ncbi:Imm10 family immunity protein [Pseudomonas purpurea]|uniref:Imm10 family immunity protein n=1 Tax=Pseudomonas purpurea TaxID=3136737 RepID=UPI003264A222